MMQLLSEELGSEGVDARGLKKAVEAGGYGKMSKQKFLDPLSTDVTISKGRKGMSGNTAVQNCLVISQRRISSEVVEKIREGIFYSPFLDQN